MSYSRYGQPWPTFLVKMMFGSQHLTPVLFILESQLSKVTFVFSKRYVKHQFKYISFHIKFNFRISNVQKTYLHLILLSSPRPPQGTRTLYTSPLSTVALRRSLHHVRKRLSGTDPASLLATTNKTSLSRILSSTPCTTPSASPRITARSRPSSPPTRSCSLTQKYPA